MFLSLYQYEIDRLANAGCSVYGWKPFLFRPTKANLKVQLEYLKPPWQIATKCPESQVGYPLHTESCEAISGQSFVIMGAA